MTVYMILFIVWLAAYYFGAAKISYDQSGSGVYAFLAFLFAPLYYPYYAFVVSKPASAPMMMGGGKGGVVGTIRSVAKGVDEVAKAILRSVPKRV